MKNAFYRYLAFTSILVGSGVRAGSFPVQARLFAQLTGVNPTALNSLMASQSLEPYKFYSALGVEMTYPVGHFLDVGLRYVHRDVPNGDATTGSITPYDGELTQDAVMAIARVPILRTALLKLDAFAGAGGSNTTFDIKTASLNGSLTKKASTPFWFASPYYATGVSVGIGYKRFYLFVEGGYEQNLVTNLTATGSVGSGASEINLSGPYGLVGLLFDGVTAHN